MLGYLAGVPGRLKTLVDRLSATWAAKIDRLDTDLTTTRAARLDATISSRATAADVTAAVAGLAAIKSVQHVNYQSANTGTGSGFYQADYTITAVDVSKAIIFFSGADFPDSTHKAGQAYFQSSTTVRFRGQRTGSTNAAVFSSFTVLEFF